MLYKVTPMLAVPVPAQKSGEGRPVRQRRKAAVYDSNGNEVLITLMCLKCRTIRPLMQFGLRKMPDGAIRNQPWCRTCRGAAGSTKALPPRSEVRADGASALAVTGVEPQAENANSAAAATAS